MADVKSESRARSRPLRRSAHFLPQRQLYLTPNCLHLSPSVTDALPRSVLVVGSGGREHALVRSLLASPAQPRVVSAPGNAGIAQDVPCYAVAADNIAELVALAQREKIEFVVVGPEVPLSLGLVDALLAAGIPAYGPKADGARLEASKVFTKQILLKYNLPTAAAGIFTEVAPALDYVRHRGAPIVIKADGLAAGKGVVVAQSLAEAEAAVLDMLAGNKFGSAGSQILVEDCMFGEETSLLVVVSGRDYVILPVSQDHKRIGDGDTGPNTGGMGTYSPAEVVTPELLARIDREIVRPSVEAIASEGIDFRGTLFIGIMLTPSGPSVLEYNTRFGDPETQVVLPRLRTDVLALLWRAAKGSLGGMKLEVRPEFALCVVVAAQGYPEKFSKGDAIKIPATLPPDTVVFHAGTARNSAGEIVTNGGRVLGVTALAPTLREAAARAYAACDSIECASKYFRRDIGARQLHRS
ncbi:MAG: phosphoribosylamine--glycine ligase [Opitutus sp.]|nr:phosphoribosylamine--glycine ligase [Opitutus sp.]